MQEKSSFSAIKNNTVKNKQDFQPKSVSFRENINSNISACRKIEKPVNDHLNSCISLNKQPPKFVKREERNNRKINYHIDKASLNPENSNQAQYFV